MKRLLALAVLTAALVAPVAAQAHPLGNFTINRFARVEVAGHRLYVRYVLDLAEIPTYQAREQGVDAGVYARRIAAGLHVTLGGRAVRLVPVAHALAFPLVVGASTRSISNELRAYPKSLLQTPLDITSDRATVAPTHEGVPALTRGKALEAPDRVADSGFTRLIAQGKLSVLVILASLAAALFWGAAHALSPGHGKTIVTAYLIGKRGTPRDAAALGAIVTVTHTLSVFALGLVTLALSQWIVPDTLYPWINLTAGVLVVSIGLAVLRTRFRHAHHDRHHHHHEGDLSRKSLLAVGVSGGLLPCPSALVVLLAAISLHRLAFGLVLIVAFSLGLALSITGLGLVAVLAKRRFAGRSFDGLLVRALPAVSAAVILAAGVAMTLRAIPKVHG